MIRAAVILESSPFDRKGLFNAVHNRLIHLVRTGECKVDVFCIHSRDNCLTRRVRKTPVTPDVDFVELDGIRYNLLWYRFSMIDHFLVEKLYKRPWLFKKFMENEIGRLRGYDVVLAHSFTGGLFAYEAFRRFSVPYFMTWHGSDVHTHPWRVPVILEDSRKIMEAAKCNFFVSRALMDFSEKITAKACKDVLYNGVSDDFREYEVERKEQTRARYGLNPGDKTVAFVGTLAAVKNVGVLASLFEEIRGRYKGQLKFWIVGDGKKGAMVKAQCEELCSRNPAVDIRFLGDRPSGEMPDIMNCIDVLVLPSLNEGLPLVCAEALRSGANAVGSDVGGMSEVLGRENVFSHGETLVSEMATRVVEMLDSNVLQLLPETISWSEICEKEIDYLRRLN